MLKHPPHHIFDHTPETLRAWCEERRMAPFRAQQILEWVYQKGVADPAAMSNLSKRDRDALAAEMTFLSGPTVSHQRASDGTQKLLIEWTDYGMGMGAEASRGASDEEPSEKAIEARGPGPLARALPILSSPPAQDSSRQTECVMIPYGEETFRASGARGDEDDGPQPVRVRRTACISSQVGCPVGCRFCASGIGGWDANLSAGRIVEQVWRLGSLGGPALRADSPGSTRITNVVFMGMGEPLSNFASVTRAIRTITAPWGLGISARKVTISTVGLPKAIQKLADEFDLPVTLALSLHAPNDQVRRELIPWAEYTSVPELLAACQRWFEKTGREITLEYILLGGVNDLPEHAHELARLARTIRANVNLIRYNEVRGMPFARPEDQAVLTFQSILRKAGVNAHIRASRGRDISAACGQLRHEKKAV